MRPLLVAMALLLAVVRPAAAAVAFSEFDSGGVTTNATSYATTSLTPSASTLYVLGVVNTKAATPDTPTVTGQGQTWTQIVSRANADDTARLTIFRALGGSTLGALTIDFAGATQTGAAWKILAVTGMDTSGTNGSGAIVQTATNAGTSTAITMTLAALASATNGEVAFCSSKTQDTFTAEWTESGAEVSYATPGTTLGAMYGTPNDVTALCTFVNNTGLFGYAIEIAQAGGAAARVPLVGGRVF